MTNQLHGRGRARMFAGFSMCSRGLAAVRRYDQNRRHHRCW